MRFHLGRDDGSTLETVEDAGAGMNLLLPCQPPEEFPLLKIADPHSYAAYWHRDIDAFLAEWDELSKRATGPEVAEVLGKVRAPAQKVKADARLLLRFEGDFLE